MSSTFRCIVCAAALLACANIVAAELRSDQRLLVEHALAGLDPAMRKAARADTERRAAAMSPEQVRGMMLALGIDSNAPAPVMAGPPADRHALKENRANMPAYSKVEGIQFHPHEAVVRTGQSIELQIIVCSNELEPDAEDELDLPAPPGHYRCVAGPSAAEAYRKWSVNGSPGGGTTFGTIAYRGDGQAVYTAPEKKPNDNIVSVSVQRTETGGPLYKKSLLVASITIEDMPDCSAFQSARALDVDLRIDPFSYAGSGNYHRITGRQYGHIQIRVKKMLDAYTEQMLARMGRKPPFDLWHSHPDPQLKGGLISMDDTDVYTPPTGSGYTHRFIGRAAPYTGMDAPSFVSLKIDYETCAFDLAASFTTKGSENGQPGKLLGAGGLFLLGQLIPGDQAKSRTLQGSRDIRIQTEIDVTGYTPGQASPLTTIRGSTTAHWTITPVQ